MLLYRERHGISTSIHVALTSVLERTTARDDVVSALSEISGTVEHCLDKFLSELNTTSTQLAAPSQPSLHTSLVRYTRLGLRLPDTVVQHILTAAINRYAIPSERRRRVLQVSATNQQWRAVAKQHLWTRLDDLEPRELTNLPRLLEFAAPQVLLTVELDMQFGDAIQIHNALAGHMNRMRLLKLSNATVGPALLTPAHRLETLTLVFSEHSTLPIHLFGHVAPRLASVELLGRFPKLLGGYEVFRGVKWLKANIGDRRDDTPIHIRHLRRAFPHLETLILNETFGLQPTHTMASDPHWSLKRLEVHEQKNLAQTQGFVCQMPALGHERLEHIHIIRGAPNTLTFLKRRVATVTRMFLLSSPADGHIIVTLVDENGFTRMLSQGSHTLIDKILSFSDLFANLVELALWEYMHSHQASAIAALEFPLVRALTIFVRGIPDGIPGYLFSPRCTMHIFSSAGQWRLPAIHTLRLTSDGDIVGANIFGRPAQRPVVPQARLEVFAGRLPMGYVQGRKLQRLVLQKLDLDDKSAVDLLHRVALEVSIS